MGKEKIIAIQDIRQKISRILVRWTMPTRQVAIIEIARLFITKEKAIKREERLRILKILKKIDQERWYDAQHCSCLAHAIWQIDKSYRGGHTDNEDE